MIAKPGSLLDYYTINQINPVPIALDTDAKWATHVAKRRKLYEHHLGIPVALLRGQHVLEVGCNSGENALVLADAGAKLTLVEPNVSMHPRVRKLFASHGKTKAIKSLSADTLESFSAPAGEYDVVIAEGFIFVLNNREAMLERLFELASARGIVITSYNDSYGMTIEMVKRAVLRRACECMSIPNWEGEASLFLTRDLFFEEFSKIPTSRPISAWWKDTLVNPFVTAPYFWTLQDLLPIAEQAGFGVLGSSPRWDMGSLYSWYKSAGSLAERHGQLQESYRRALPVFLSGSPAAVDTTAPASDDVLAAIQTFVSALSAYTTEEIAAEDVKVPEALLRYIGGSADERFRALGHDLAQIPTLLTSDDLQQLKARYAELHTLRSTWGMPYHYLSFIAE
jgi:SAM-dependent methyltransferase